MSACPWIPTGPSRLKTSSALLLVSLLAGASVAQGGEGAGFDEEIVVVAPTPSTSMGLVRDKLPFNVQAADSDALERAQSLDLTDFLNVNLGSVNINSAQGNPLQPDVQYRGFSASPLLGLPQGISVYQNGVRINEPFGDSVNWDLLPGSTIHSITLIGGANPLFGLNTLGGALSINLKNGFNFAGHQAELSGGSWDRVTGSVQSGGNNETFGYYVNVHYFEEEGWRDASESDAKNALVALSWRGPASSLDLSMQYGGSELRGNGPSPVGLLAIDREAFFTAPDITENDMHMFTLQGVHDITDLIQIGGNAFYRATDTDSFNGDASEFRQCNLTGGTFLIEGLADDDLQDLGLTLDNVCANNALAVADPAALAAALNGMVAGEPFNIDDLTGELSGTGILADDAINNTSVREQGSYGADIQLTFINDLFNRENYFVSGISFYNGQADFRSRLELSGLDPVTRSTAVLGTGTFVDGEAVKIFTESETWSLYFLDTFDLTETVSLTAGGRYNDTDITLRDRAGDRPELNGEHNFSRFNPAVGITVSPFEHLNLFAGYSESSRAPTPIELACNDGVFDLARQFAIANGEDPDNVKLECRLPNAFLADPPLDQVVAKSVEVGIRGSWGPIEHRSGFFHTVNENDIIFQTTGRSTGLFANVDETKRQGIETALAGTWANLDWFLAYTYVEATFEDNFSVLSPNHERANSDGEIFVSEGDRIPGIPDHQLKLGGDYHFENGTTLGFEVLYNSAQVLRGDESNQLEGVDGHAVVNLRASHRFNERVEAFARVTNLFDEDYENFGLLGEKPDEVLPGIRDTRPRFLGAGAPRGAWVGMRLSF